MPNTLVVNFQEDEGEQPPQSPELSLPDSMTALVSEDVPEMRVTETDRTVPIILVW